MDFDEEAEADEGEEVEEWEGEEDAEGADAFAICNRVLNTSCG